MLVLGLIIGLVAGAAAVLLMPVIAAHFPALAALLARFRKAVPVSLGDALPQMGESTLAFTIEAAIADIEAQIRNRVDAERNLIRLAQLREIMPEAPE